MSIIWSKPLSDHNRVTASNQFALPVLGYLMWTQQWPVTEFKKLDREARKIVVENGGKHSSRSTAILLIHVKREGRQRSALDRGGVQSDEDNGCSKLYGNGDSAMAMVREFEERVEELDHSSLVKEAARYAEEMGLQLELDYPNLTFIKHDSGKVTTAEKLMVEI